MPSSLSSFADSGCTIHFFKNREVFSSYKPLNRVEGQSSKEGTSFTILGSGNVEFKVMFEGRENTLMFHDTLHAPDITANLLSISRMDRAGWSVEFSRGRVRFFNKDKIEVFGGILKNGLYLVQGSFSGNKNTDDAVRQAYERGYQRGRDDEARMNRHADRSYDSNNQRGSYDTGNQRGSNDTGNQRGSNNQRYYDNN